MTSHEEGKIKGIFYAFIALLLYVLSDVITKKFLLTVPVIDISIVRFAAGVPLIVFASRNLLKSFHAIGFAIVNTINSVAGAYALTSGSMAGFAVASQLRPLFVSAFGVLLFKAFFSYQSFLLLLAACAISVFAFYSGEDIAKTPNIIFIVTVALQSLAFAAFGTHHSMKDVLAFTGLYNLVGFTICLLAKVVTAGPSVEMANIHLNLGNAVVALSGSIFAVAGYRSRYKVQVSAVNYIRLPLSLGLAYVMFDEKVTLATVVCCLLLILVVYTIGAADVRARTGTRA